MLVAVEVKTRRTATFGSPLEAVTRAQGRPAAAARGGVARRARTRASRACASTSWASSCPRDGAARSSTCGASRDRPHPFGGARRGSRAPDRRRGAPGRVASRVHPRRPARRLAHEARDRVRAAVASSALTWPQRRITVNLSPASLPKSGSVTDLAIAVAVMAAAGMIDRRRAAPRRPPGGARPRRPGAARPRHPAVRDRRGRGGVPPRWSFPRPTPTRRAWCPARDVVGVARSPQLAALYGNDEGRARRRTRSCAPRRPASAADEADVRPGRRAGPGRGAMGARGGGRGRPPPADGRAAGRGQDDARLPAAGDPPGHGAGGRDRGHLHPLDRRHARRRARACSRGPRSRRRTTPPRPPRSSGAAAHLARPGAISRAHAGVLFLDEAPEFPAGVLQTLRQPLESGEVVLHRAGGAARYPARFQLVLAANPCPCGRYSGGGEGCSCTPMARRRYFARLSGPLLDRVDLHIAVRPVRRGMDDAGEGTPVVAARVASARRAAAERLRGTGWALNARVPRRVAPRPHAAGGALRGLRARSTGGCSPRAGWTAPSASRGRSRTSTAAAAPRAEHANQALVLRARASGVPA